MNICLLRRFRKGDLANIATATAARSRSASLKEKREVSSTLKTFLSMGTAMYISHSYHSWSSYPGVQHVERQRRRIRALSLFFVTPCVDLPKTSKNCCFSIERDISAHITDSIGNFFFVGSIKVYVSGEGEEETAATNIKTVEKKSLLLFLSQSSDARICGELPFSSPP